MQWQWVTLPKLANQSYVNKLINQSKYWVELLKHQWYEHSKIIIYCIYHSFQESLWYRLQVILLSNHLWTTSKFLANIYVKFKYKFKIFMMFTGQKSSFISLVHRTGILRKQFWSSLFDTEFTKKFKQRRRIWFVPYLLPNSTQIALIMPFTLWHSFFTVYVLCNYCLRTSLPPVLILRVFVIDFPPCLNLIQHKNNIKPEFKTIYCIKLILLFYSLSFLTTQTNCLKFRPRSNGISSLNIFFSSSIL